MDFLKSAVASAISKGPLAGYSLAERVDVENSIWALHNAVKREGGTNCSVFVFDIAANRSRLPVARNAVRKSRTLHHPGVIKVLDTIETETHIYLITERLVPLSWQIRRGSLREETTKWGLWSIAKTIKFINDASSVHGCVRASSVFTGESGEWKIGGFELLSSMNDDEAVIYRYSSLVPDSGRCMPPEVSKSGWDTIKKSPLTAVDSWGFGILCVEAFDGSLSGQDPAAQMKSLPPSMQQQFKRLVNPNPKLRLSVSNFLDQGRRDGGFFQSPLINLSEGIESLGLKSDGEREEFLNELNEVSQEFPDDYLKRKILPELLKSVEFGGGGAQVFTVVLKIGAKLSEYEYEEQLTPVLLRLFGSPDRALRVCLLDNLPLMIDRLSQKNVNDKVFPNMVTGFTDMAPVVREQTVKAVLTVIPKLSDRVINGELLKYLAKTSNDEQPGIRTNTTICLGKIAKHLGPNTRGKVLVAAFTRSLRDPFVHARNAALMALGATADMFSEDDCANKVLPAICPSLLDKEKMIRDQANKALDIYLQRVRKHAQTMPETTQPANNNTTTANGSRSATPQPRIAKETDSTWTGWAISSFTNKLAATNGEIEPRPNGATIGTSSRTLNPTASAARINPTQPSTKPTLSRNSTATTKLAQSFETPEAAATNDDWNDDAAAEEAQDAADAWGAMGDDIADDAEGGDEHGDNEDDASTFFGSTAPSRQSTASTASSVAKTFDDGGEPDFAGWLKAQQSAKQAKVAPLKGVGLATGGAKKTGAANVAAVKKPVVAKPVAASRTVVKKPPEPEQVEEEDEGWGDAWE